MEWKLGEQEDIYFTVLLSQCEYTEFQFQKGSDCVGVYMHTHILTVYLPSTRNHSKWYKEWKQDVEQLKE